MRASLFIIALLTLLFSNLSCYAETNQRVKVVEPFISLYTGPGVGYPIFLDLERGSWLTILHRQVDWYQVMTDKKETGWVRHADLAKTVGPDDLPVRLYSESQNDLLQRDWELGAMWGKVEGSSISSLVGSYVINRNLAVDLSFSQIIGSLSSSKLYELNLIAQPFPEWRVSPYFMMGTGRIKTATTATLVKEKDSDDRTASVGIGIRTYLTRSFFLRAEYRELVIFTSTNDYEELDIWSVGVGSFF